jgi:transcriptional regulator with XRE-family HTH domain
VPRKNRTREPRQGRTKFDFTVQIEAFGRKVRALRQELGLTIEELAERAELSPNHVSAVERGKKNPGLETIHALAGALGVSADVLVNGGRPAGESFSAKGREFIALLQPLAPELQICVTLLLRPHAGRRDST